MASKFRNIPPKTFINFLLKLIVQKVWLVQVKHLWEETMLHRLQVTIDLHKSKLYVKFQRHQIFRFRSRRTLNSRIKWWVETLLRKQRSKYTNEGSNVAVSGLWFTVSGKIWEIEPIPEQTLKIVFTGTRSLYFSYIWFDLSNSRIGFKTRLQGV